MTDAIDDRFLHWPDRVHHFESLDDHAETAAALTRAAWLLLTDDVVLGDPRDRDALRTVLSIAADHASAAAALISARRFPHTDNGSPPPPVDPLRF